MRFLFLLLSVVLAMVFASCNEESVAPEKTITKQVIKTIYVEVTDTLQDTIPVIHTDTVIEYQNHEIIELDTLLANPDCKTEDNGSTITVTCNSKEVRVSKAICDTVSYDPQKSFCYQGKVIDLCEGVVYNPGKSFCYEDSLVDFCNGKSFNPKIRQCIDGAIVPYCGKVPYDTTKHFCIDKVIYMYCGGKEYDPTKQYCHNNESPADFGYITDERDGQVYKTVEIGTQTWLAENLRYAYNVVTALFDSLSYCYLDSCDTYGRYYPWAGAMDSAALFSNSTAGCGNGYTQPIVKGVHRGICPEGWHVPDTTEFRNLLRFVDANNGDEYVGKSLGSPFPYTQTLVDSVVPSNIFGFSAVPTTWLCILSATGINYGQRPYVYTLAWISPSGTSCSRAQRLQMPLYFKENNIIGEAGLTCSRGITYKPLRCIKDSED